VQGVLGGAIAAAPQQGSQGHRADHRDLTAALEQVGEGGRDLYDLMWYLGRPQWPDPNLDFLNDALKRSGWNRAALDSSTWLAAVQGRLAVTDWERVRADVAAFLETPQEASLLAEDVFQDLLERRRLSGPQR
jgi:hypothetical protein